MSGQVIDNANSFNNAYYTATCDVNHGGFDLGCDYLTFSKSANTNSETTSLTYDFDKELRILEFTISV